MSLCNNKQKALLELIELLNKGIDLLANNNLDKDLYNAFEKYVQSTIKLVDAAYMTTYEFSFSTSVDPLSSYRYNPMGIYHDISSSLFSRPNMLPQSYGNYMTNIYSNLGTNSDRDYKLDLKILLQRLISIFKVLVSDY